MKIDFAMIQLNISIHSCPLKVVIWNKQLYCLKILLNLFAQGWSVLNKSEVSGEKAAKFPSQIFPFIQQKFTVSPWKSIAWQDNRGQISVICSRWRQRSRCWTTPALFRMLCWQRRSAVRASGSWSLPRLSFSPSILPDCQLSKLSIHVVSFVLFHQMLGSRSARFIMSLVSICFALFRQMFSSLSARLVISSASISYLLFCQMLSSLIVRFMMSPAFAFFPLLSLSFYQSHRSFSSHACPDIVVGVHHNPALLSSALFSRAVFPLSIDQPDVFILPCWTMI